jgi:hypothetical protein
LTRQDYKRNVSARRRATAVVAAVALIGAVSSAIAAGAAAAAALSLPPSQPPSSTEQFGANTGVLFNSGKYTPAQIDAQLAALSQTGATVVRSDALWEDAEPQPPIGLLHRYNWSFDDLIVRSLASHGLRWLPIIDYSAPWAQSVHGQDHSPPSSVSDYAAYAAAVATRYGPGGYFWIENPQLTPLPVQTYEIWNEPDNPVFWHPTPDPSAYATLYTSARGAITAAQPGAQVMIGGLMHPASFLSAMLGADPGLRDQIDGVGIHPYAATPNDVLAGVRSARLAMRSDGLASVPLYVTEFGWTTHKSGAHDWAPEQLRPGYISRTLATLGHTDCGIAAVLLYAWATPERDPANAEDWFGVSPPGAGGSPDSAAFSSGLVAAGAPGPTISLCAGGAAPGTTRVSRGRPQARASRRHRRPRAHRAGRRSRRS